MKGENATWIKLLGLGQIEVVYFTDAVLESRLIFEVSKELRM